MHRRAEYLSKEGESRTPTKVNILHLGGGGDGKKGRGSSSLFSRRKKR